MRTLIKNAKIILPDRILNDAWLVIENDRIDNFGIMPMSIKITHPEIPPLD